MKVEHILASNFSIVNLSEFAATTWYTRIERGNSNRFHTGLGVDSHLGSDPSRPLPLPVTLSWRQIAKRECSVLTCLQRPLRAIEYTVSSRLLICKVFRTFPMSVTPTVLNKVRWPTSDDPPGPLELESSDTTATLLTPSKLKERIASSTDDEAEMCATCP